jgi:hypothetical protein
MGVAAEIFESLLWPAEWPFAVNHSIVAIEVINEGMKRNNRRVDQQADFFGTQHFGQAYHSFWIWSFCRVPGSVQSFYEEETQCRQAPRTVISPNALSGELRPIHFSGFATSTR